jgi:membrane protein YdbS with pleckstrin-like domain
MQCPVCGVETVWEAVFCHRCGARLAKKPNEQVADAPESAHSDQPLAAGSAASFPAGVEIPGSEKLTAAMSPSATAPEEVEREVWEGTYSPRAMAGNWALTAIIAVALLIVWIIWVRTAWLWWLLVAGITLAFFVQLAVLAYRRLSVRYRLTTQRFMHQRGLLRRVTDRIEVIRIDDIAYEQGLLERLVGVGTIRIYSSDQTHPTLYLPGIENVAEVAGLLDEVRRAERRRRGLHIEQI